MNKIHELKTVNKWVWYGLWVNAFLQTLNQVLEYLIRHFK